jgi:hypothetical protein
MPLLLSDAGAGGMRQVEVSQRWSAAHCESSLQTPGAGRHSQGPMQLSLPAHTSCSPALQFGYVQPQRAISSGGRRDGSGEDITRSHGHW